MTILPLHPHLRRHRIHDLTSLECSILSPNGANVLESLKVDVSQTWRALLRQQLSRGTSDKPANFLYIDTDALKHIFYVLQNFSHSKAMNALPSPLS
jgi:hypothetical protein